MVIDFFAPRLFFSISVVPSILMIQGLCLRVTTKKDCLMLSIMSALLLFSLGQSQDEVLE